MMLNQNTSCAYLPPFVCVCVKCQIFVHLYVVKGEGLIQSEVKPESVYIYIWVFFSYKNSFLYSGFKSFVRYVIYKYFLP
jgi:hypothetical protein